MLATLDDIFRTLVLVRRWILLSVRHTYEDDQQEKKLHRAHDLKSSLPSDCRRTGNNASSCSWPDALEQLCDLPRLCPAQSLVPLLRQSMHLGAQGNQMLDLLVEVAVFRTQQVTGVVTGGPALVALGASGF